MVVVCLREVWIAAPRTHNLAGARVTQCLDVELRTSLTPVAITSAVKASCKSDMKYLVIGVLVSIIFVLVYARVRPYLKLIQKIVQSLNVVTDINTSITSNQKTPSRNQLVRCDRCGAFIPAERALSLKSGLANFCSTECMEKEPVSNKRKIAG